MIILISPSEPSSRVQGELLQHAVRFKDLPIDYRFWAGRRRVDIEFKDYPDDFLASWRDGRLRRQCQALAKADVGILMLGGALIGQDDDYVCYSSGRASGFRVRQIQHRLLTLMLSGIAVVWVENDQAVAGRVLNLHRYFAKTRHISIRSRQHRGWEWGVPSGREVFAEMLSGIPDLGPTRIDSLIKAFPDMASLAAAEIPAIQAINGLGPKTAHKVYNVLRGQV